MRLTVFEARFREDLTYFIVHERKVALRLLQLVAAVARDPFKGEGKPEPLKGFAPNTWSRRLTQEHRLVYLVKHESIHFLQARFHY